MTIRGVRYSSTISLIKMQGLSCNFNSGYILHLLQNNNRFESLARFIGEPNPVLEATTTNELHEVLRTEYVYFYDDWNRFRRLLGEVRNGICLGSIEQSVMDLRQCIDDRVSIVESRLPSDGTRVASVNMVQGHQFIHLVVVPMSSMMKLAQMVLVHFMMMFLHLGVVVHQLMMKQAHLQW